MTVTLRTVVVMRAAMTSLQADARDKSFCDQRDKLKQRLKPHIRY